MIYAKVNKVSRAIVEAPSDLPKILKTAAEGADPLAHYAPRLVRHAHLGEDGKQAYSLVTVDPLGGTDIADHVWYPIVDIGPVLGLLETEGPSEYTVDEGGKGVLRTWSVVPAAQDDLDFYWATKANTLIDGLKASVQEYIYKLYPAWKQANALARGSEILEIRISGGTLTPEEEDDLDFIKNIRQNTTNLRAASDAAEVAVVAAIGNLTAMRAAATVDWSSV